MVFSLLEKLDPNGTSTHPVLLLPRTRISVRSCTPWPLVGRSPALWVRAFRGDLQCHSASGAALPYCTIADQDQCPRGTASLSLRLFDSCVGRLVVFAFAFLASSSRGFRTDCLIVKLCYQGPQDEATPPINVPALSLGSRQSGASSTSIRRPARRHAFFFQKKALCRTCRPLPACPLAPCSDRGGLVHLLLAHHVESEVLDVSHLATPR